MDRPSEACWQMCDTVLSVRNELGHYTSFPAILYPVDLILTYVHSTSLVCLPHTVSLSSLGILITFNLCSNICVLTCCKGKRSQLASKVQDLPLDTLEEFSFSKMFWCSGFYARSQNCEKRLASSWSSVRPPAWNNSAPIGRILMNFDIWAFFENLWGKFKFR